MIAVDDWSASVEMRAKKPVAVQFRAALDSLRVESGSGGITPLTPVDRQVIVRNATKTLDVKRHPEVTFRSSEMATAAGRVDVVGEHAGGKRRLFLDDRDMSLLKGPRLSE